MKQFFQKPAVRQSVQAALAVGLSIYFGTLLSGRRWYWAAIAAFIVGIGVGSRGESLTKGIQRVAGTVLASWSASSSPLPSQGTPSLRSASSFCACSWPSMPSSRRTG